MRDSQPPTDDEIKEYVEQVLHDADLEKITMKMVCQQVCSHYPDFDLTHRKDFIKATIKFFINSEPTMAQMEKLVIFLEENPEIAKMTYDHENLEMTQKWKAIAKELNLMRGAIRSGYCWAQVWNELRRHLNYNPSGITQPYTPEMMERMINLLERLGIDETPVVTFGMAAESPSFMEPTMAQMEKLVKFLEENPEIAKRTDQANNAHERLQMTQKWVAIANELNFMGGAKRSGESWADLWNVSRSHINDIIAERKSATGARGGIIQPYTPEMMERMINLLEGLGIDETPAVAFSTAAELPSDEEIKNYVKQILEGANLEVITMKMVIEQVYSHYANFDLRHKKDFIKATIKSCI